MTPILQLWFCEEVVSIELLFLNIAECKISSVKSTMEIKSHIRFLWTIFMIWFHSLLHPTSPFSLSLPAPPPLSLHRQFLREGGRRTEEGEENWEEGAAIGEGKRRMRGKRENNDLIFGVSLSYDKILT